MAREIIMIDDSIVRGTTSDRIVKMLRDAGAKEVHVRISSPPFLWPCYFGTDVPAREQLIAYNRSIEDIRQIIGADSLGYLGDQPPERNGWTDSISVKDALQVIIHWNHPRKISEANTISKKEMRIYI